MPFSKKSPILYYFIGNAVVHLQIIYFKIYRRLRQILLHHFQKFRKRDTAYARPRYVLKKGEVCDVSSISHSGKCCCRRRRDTLCEYFEGNYSV